MSERTTAREIAELARQRLAATDMSGFTDLFSADAVFEYPFGYPGAPSELRGREEIRTHLVESRRGVRALINVVEFNAIVHETADPDVVVAETEVVGTNVATGQEFRFPSGVAVFTVRNGEIVRYRDYTNPLGAAQVTGQLPALIASLGASA